MRKRVGVARVQRALFSPAPTTQLASGRLLEARFLNSWSSNWRHLKKEEKERKKRKLFLENLVFLVCLFSLTPNDERSSFVTKQQRIVYMAR